jgi:hypothetical protein
MKFILIFTFGWIVTIWGFFDTTACILAVVFWAFVLTDLLFLRDEYE